MLATKMPRSLLLSSIKSKFDIPALNGIYKRTAWTAVKSQQVPDNIRSRWPKPSFNIDKMTELLDHDNHAMRKEFRKFLSDPVFTPRYNIPLHEERDVSIHAEAGLKITIKNH